MASWVLLMPLMLRMVMSLILVAGVLKSLFLSAALSTQHFFPVWGSKYQPNVWPRWELER